MWKDQYSFQARFHVFFSSIYSCSKLKSNNQSNSIICNIINMSQLSLDHDKTYDKLSGVRRSFSKASAVFPVKIENFVSPSFY